MTQVFGQQTRELRDSVITRWYERLAGNPSPRRNHWQTKVVYYRAVAELLASRPHQPLSWKCIVGAAHPLGKRSTYYEVAGSHARHRMVDDLIADGAVGSIEIALRYQRRDPVQQLIDETKVWSFWSYRQWMVEHEPTTDGLTRALVAWSARRPTLAAANGGSPPACAVEDLVILTAGRLAPTRALHRLTDVLHEAAAGR